MRFNIRSLMIAVAAVALMLGLPGPIAMKLIAVAPTALMLCGVPELVRRGHRRMVAGVFWTWAGLANVVFAFACLTPDIYVEVVLKFLWAMLVLPVCATMGTAWVILSRRQPAGRAGRAGGGSAGCRHDPAAAGGGANLVADAPGLPPRPAPTRAAGRPDRGGADRPVPAVGRRVPAARCVVRAGVGRRGPVYRPEPGRPRGVRPGGYRRTPPRDAG